MTAFSVHVTGTVQGVGFRPFVYGLARSSGITGWVRNTSEGVFCLVEGDANALEAFVRDIREKAPPMAVVDAVFTEEVEPEGFDDFRIEESEAGEGAMTLVSPDIATCAACESELLDPTDRRYRYPFTNCTNCGPRFTIVADIPYDRPATTMRDFPMCPECAAEYGDPADRRFHAQPNACAVCGPRLYLNPAEDSGLEMPADWLWAPGRETVPRPHGERLAERERTDAILADAARLLREGRIVAVKGLGGFQLACDATDEDAVARLRERKHRWGKPLAVMVADIDAARRLAHLEVEEEALLTGPVRPIVLLGLRENGAPLAPSVAPRLSEVGVMLPYTPLHHLLVREAGRPLVMTSGNLSDEPIATGNEQALERLSGIADAFLMHDRDIRGRYDDSVLRVVGGLPVGIRRARGYAPHPLRLRAPSDVHLLAVGPEQKNTFTLVREDLAFVSQHIGDMENAETMESFEDTLALYEKLFRISPEIVAHDLHPEYLTTKLAMALDLPRIGVQHHHAHIASVLGEHDSDRRTIGVALDGTGYGTDGHVWGGEFLIADATGFERFGHLGEVPMPGGAAAIRRPARMALGTLWGFGLLGHPGAAPLRARLAASEEETLVRMMERGLNCPATSSMGRLFDTVAALAGIRDDALYEGQAAIELEAAADMATDEAYRFAIDGTGPVVLDAAPVIEAVLDDVARGVHASSVSARFHTAVVDAVVRMAALAADAALTEEVALAGGVFMNRIVLAGCLRSLPDAGLTPLTHTHLPMNDAAVSFGQAVVACARRRGI